MKASITQFRCISKLLVACSLLVSLSLHADMAPLAAAYRYQPSEVRSIWAKIDLDGDGTISREELREEDPRLLAGFEQADLDHDGTLSLRELELLLMSV